MQSVMNALSRTLSLKETSDLSSSQTEAWADTRGDGSLEKRSENENPTSNDDFTNIEMKDADDFYSRENIESLAPTIRLTDSTENGLSLFCYTHCNNETSNDIKSCRGLVFHNDKLIMKAFPYTTEIISSDIQSLNSLRDQFLNARIYNAYEGTLIRSFYFEGKWYTTTHRKLDAYKSKWASRESFGESFVKALMSLPEFRDAKKENVLESFYETLNKDLKYMFLVRNNEENRIVCAPPEKPTVYHVGTFDTSGELRLDINCLVPKSISHNFISIEQMVEFVNSTSPRDLQGVIMFLPNNTQIKVISESFYRYFAARDNVASIKFRYLQVRNQPETVAILKELYPNMISAFEEYEHILDNIAKNIFFGYVQRYIRKLYNVQPKEEFMIAKICQEWHLQNKKVNKVNLVKVISVLNTQPPTSLNKMVRRYRENLQKAANSPDEQV